MIGPQISNPGDVCYCSKIMCIKKTLLKCHFAGNSKLGDCWTVGVTLWIFERPSFVQAKTYYLSALRSAMALSPELLCQSLVSNVLPKLSMASSMEAGNLSCGRCLAKCAACSAILVESVLPV